MLSSVGFNALFYGDLSIRFPSLKELTLRYCCNDQDELRISSRSLELLNFASQHPSARVEFDVPSIRKFSFEGDVIHSPSFKSTSSICESHLSLDCKFLGSSWFLEMNKFFAELSRSKIHLSLHGGSYQSFDYEAGDYIQGLLKKREVENLTVDLKYLPSLTCYALLDGLFRLCRPKSITQYLIPKSCSRWKTNNYFLCKKLVQGMNGEFSKPSNFMYGLHDLEDVNAQLYDEVIAAWSDVPLKTFLDASTSPRKIRFQLKWKPLPITF